MKAWWDYPAAKSRGLTEPANQLYAQGHAVWNDDTDRRAEMAHYLRLYGLRYFTGIDDSMSLVDFAQSMMRSEHSLRYNLVKSIIDAGVSRIGKQKPRGTIVTNGASWSVMNEARRVERYCAGVIHTEKAYAKGRQVFRDGMMIGTGIFKLCPAQTKGGWKVALERSYPWEWAVDTRDADHGEPRTMYHITWIDAGVAKARWGLTDSDIEQASEKQRKDYAVAESTRQVMAVEAWHLPSEPGAGDGRHAISIGSKLAFWEEWDEDWFPVSVFHWTQPVRGFWGISATKDLNGLQIETNRLLGWLQDAYSMFARPKVLVHRNSKIVKSHFDNRMGTLLEWEGNIPPQVVTFQPVHPQMLQQIEQYKKDGRDVVGMSEMSVVNRKPADLESGAALREWNDIDEGRHSDPSMSFEEMWTDLHYKIIGMSRYMAKRGQSPKTVAPFRRRSSWQVEEIKWADCQLDMTQYAVMVMPSSSLPSTPAGRTATVESWLKAGMISLDEARYLFEIHDLDAISKLRLAPFETLLDVLESIIDRGEYVAPEPFQPLQQSVELVQLAYLRAKLDAVPEERLDMLRIYMSQTQALIARSQPAPQAQAPMPGMPQPGMPLTPGVMGAGIAPQADPNAAMLAALTPGGSA